MKTTVQIDAKSSTTDFTVGSWVKWTSGARGSYTEKCGRIVEVVPPGKPPSEAVKDPKNPLDSMYTDGFGRSIRSHRSFVVLVRRHPGKNRLYWPLAKNLKPAEDPQGKEKAPA